MAGIAIGFNAGPPTLIASPLRYGILTPNQTLTQAGVIQPAVKWNPGHNGLSQQVVKPSDNRWASRRAEIDLIFSDAGGPGGISAYVQGYMDIHYWNSIEDAAAGTYNWANVDQARDYIQANYPGKRYGVMIWGQNFGSTSPASCVPSYIYNSSSYGSSPTGGQYGYWTLAPAGGAATAVSVAWWRSAVAARVQALYASLAAHQSAGQASAGIANYDADLYFYNVTWQESALALTSGSDYSPSSAITQWEATNAAIVASFPRTNVLSQNNFMGTGTTQGQVENMVATEAANRIAMSGPDVFGASGAPGNLTWGQTGYVGLNGYPDQRSHMPYFALVEGDGSNGEDYAYTVSDIGAAALGTGTYGLNASNIWWMIVSGGNGNWTTNVLPFIKTNPITNTGYPANYP